LLVLVLKEFLKDNRKDKDKVRIHEIRPEDIPPGDYPPRENFKTGTNPYS